MNRKLGSLAAGLALVVAIGVTSAFAGMGGGMMGTNTTMMGTGTNQGMTMTQGIGSQMGNMPTTMPSTKMPTTGMMGTSQTGDQDQADALSMMIPTPPAP